MLTGLPSRVPFVVPVAVAVAVTVFLMTLLPNGDVVVGGCVVFGFCLHCLVKAHEQLEGESRQHELGRRSPTLKIANGATRTCCLHNCRC